MTRSKFLLFVSSLLLAGVPSAFAASASLAPLPIKPDITVATDGSGDFKTIQAAVASIPNTNRERRIIFVKDGVYKEKVRVDAPYITIRGQSRAGTRLEFGQGLNEFSAASDTIGRAVLNINDGASDFVLENLTVENTHGVIGVHAFAIFGRGDRTVIQDCDIHSQGNDTLSLWRTSEGQSAEDARTNPNANGRYYHARIKVSGSVDLICPRGWCYVTDSEFIEVNPRGTGAIWHDGSRDQDMKFVMSDCRFDGLENWVFLRWHRDGQFYLINAKFSKAMGSREPYQYPIKPLPTDRPATAQEVSLFNNYTSTNIWGKRVYYSNSHRDGGDYEWHKDNLATAPGSPKPTEITAKWTFAGKWDPENKEGPAIRSILATNGKVTVTFTDTVTVRGKPRVVLRDGVFGDYVSGSGSDTLTFSAPPNISLIFEKIDLQGSTIIGNEAATTLRFASLQLP